MATSRAEARRKAILARGNDRLAKLTTSARGEDHPVYSHVEDPPVPKVLDNRRVGDESFIQPPRLSSQSRTPSASSRSRTPPVGSSNTPPDPAVWSEDLQQQFMQALMGGAAPPRMPPYPDIHQPALPAVPGNEFNINSGDPLASLMAQFSQGQPGQTSSVSPPKPRTLLQKLVPILHLLSVWALLAYFVLWKEPEAFQARTFGAAASEGRWERWAELGRGTVAEWWGVQAVPFFWAFMGLQISLHSLRIFSGFDAIEPPFLVTLALPHLPPPFPSLILNGLKYIQMGSFFLDDLAGLLFGLGVWMVVGGILNG